MIQVSPLRPEGLFLLEPEVHRDLRGVLVETYRDDHLRDLQLDLRIVQVNQTRSHGGVIRGLHFQAPPGQVKLITVTRGRILDIAVDIRQGSPTFGEHAAVELDDENHRQLYIPAGFAHGFAVLSNGADVMYALDRPFDASRERGIAFDDPDLGIEWRVEQPLLSVRDRSNPLLRSLDEADLRWAERR